MPMQEIRAADEENLGKVPLLEANGKLELRVVAILSIND